METQQDQTARLIERLASLSPKDREAVLSRMDAEERGDVEDAMNRHLDEVREEEERQQRIDQQFLGYSPWLAEIVEEAQEGAAGGLTETTSKALWDVHSAKVGDGIEVPQSGWQSFIDKVNSWLTPKAEASS